MNNELIKYELLTSKNTDATNEKSIVYSFNHHEIYYFIDDNLSEKKELLKILLLKFNNNELNLYFNSEKIEPNNYAKVIKKITFEKSDVSQLKGLTNLENIEVASLANSKHFDCKDLFRVFKLDDKLYDKFQELDEHEISIFKIIRALAPANPLIIIDNYDENLKETDILEFNKILDRIVHEFDISILLLVSNKNAAKFEDFIKINYVTGDKNE